MNRTVLLVDDNEDLVETLCEGLAMGSRDYEVLTALSVDAATAILDERAVDLVITDVKMPGKTGFDLLAHLIQHHPGVPSIVMTGFGTPDMERRARELGSLRFLAKPLEIAHLQSEVESVLASAAAGALLEVISQAGFFQLLSLERSTCLVTLTSDQATSELAFVEGVLCEAKAGGLTGRDAVFEVLGWKAPRISVNPLRRKPSPSEDLHLQTLLLEAARQEDERGRDGPTSAAEGAEPAPAAKDQRTTRPSAEAAEGTQTTMEEATKSENEEGGVSAGGQRSWESDFSPDRAGGPQSPKDAEKSQPRTDKESVMPDMAKVNQVLTGLQEELGAGLLATSVFSVADGQAIAAINDQPKASALFNQLTDYLVKALKQSEFPALGRYYFMELQNARMVLVVPLGDFRQGLMCDTTKVQLGMLLNITIPTLIEDMNQALA